MKRLTPFLLTACLLAACSASGFESLDNDDFERLLATGEVQLVDVRTADEFATKPHIAGAVNIDVKTADFAERAQSLLDKEKKVAVYCQRGRRSKMAAAQLTELGYTVYELNTGIENWQNAGKPVE